MAKTPDGNAKWIKTLIAFGAIVGTAVAAHTMAFNQINTNTRSIDEVGGRVVRIERLSVAIAEKLGVSVADLFSN